MRFRRTALIADYHRADHCESPCACPCPYPYPCPCPGPGPGPGLWASARRLSASLYMFTSPARTSLRVIRICHVSFVELPVSCIMSFVRRCARSCRMHLCTGMRHAVFICLSACVALYACMYDVSAFLRELNCVRPRRVTCAHACGYVGVTLPRELPRDPAPGWRRRAAPARDPHAVVFREAGAQPRTIRAPCSGREEGSGHRLLRAPARNPSTTG